MHEIILHEYPESLFSEKIRCLMGYKEVTYRSVTIPMIMPRPDLMPLTGGYRRTPVMQIGADIYCDTAIICRVLDDLFPEKPIYPAHFDAAHGAAAFWTDTFLFRASVALAFQPKAAADNPLFQDESAIGAFMADRAELSKGAVDIAMPLEVSEAHFLMHLNRLDVQLENQAFLAGDSPSILDFSTYHVCWFIYTRDPLIELFAPFEHVLAWYQRMAGFGHGNVTEMSSAEALKVGTEAEPAALGETVFLEGLSEGDAVEVMPIDYGLQPVSGSLLCASLEEIIISRQDDIAGEVAVHFPRQGFQVNAAN